ncbi:uncharacterized protein LOC110111648 [Dendrobium catenatum]|uniref:uncharacterized protein LOC110111648 n=1 Tax=Dendrobium catenatum TaxID=906689 RepID=UPI0010A011CD|nr:uncharacterized protein LOC110111648 [Dendrobium catenatum]
MADGNKLNLMSDPVVIAGSKSQLEETAGFKEGDEGAVNQNLNFKLDQQASRNSVCLSNSFNALADVDNVVADVLNETSKIGTVVSENLDSQISDFESSKKLFQPEISVSTKAVQFSNDTLINPKVVENQVPAFSTTYSAIKFKIPQTLEEEKEAESALSHSTTQGAEVSPSTTLTAAPHLNDAEVLGTHKTESEPSTTLVADDNVNVNNTHTTIHDSSSPPSAISLNFKKRAAKTGNTGATIHFGGLEFSAAIAKAAAVPVYGINSEEPSERSYSARTTARSAAQGRISVFERLSQPEILTAKRVVDGRKISMWRRRSEIWVQEDEDDVGDEDTMEIEVVHMVSHIDEEDDDGDEDDQQSQPRTRVYRHHHRTRSIASRSARSSEEGEEEEEV